MSAPSALAASRLPWTRDPHHVPEGGEDDPRFPRHGDGVVDAAHRDDAHRAAGTVHELYVGRQDMLDPVPVDRVRMAAADLHELELVVPGQESVIRATRPRAAAGSRYSSTNFIPATLLGGIGVPSAVAARATPSSSVSPVALGDLRLSTLAPRRRKPDPSAAASRALLAASASSILAMAKPTWMSTQSPGSRPSSSRRRMLMLRRTPATSTLARCRFSSRSSTTSPGIPRHMAHSFLWNRDSTSTTARAL